MLQFFTQLSALVVVPTLALAWLAIARANHMAMLAYMAAAAGYFALLLLVAPWSFIWYPLGLIFFISLCVILARRLFRLTQTPWSYPENRRALIQTSLWMIGACVAWGLVIPVASGLRAHVKTVDLTFPLEGGIFVVGHGGSNTVLNYHNSHKSQRFALDIAQLNAAGLRAWGVYPKELNRYAIYGARVVSPCAGTVVATDDGHPDLIPPKRDSANPAGNHIVIECQGVAVYIAHLMPGSLQVSVGESVGARDFLGFVGNSGNTSEPHLHIHAEAAYTESSSVQPGVALTFDGRFLVRNSLVQR